MKSILLCLSALLFLNMGRAQSFRSVETEYLEAWKAFYPSQAAAQGMHGVIFEYEARDRKKIRAWLTYNKKTLARLSDPQAPYVVHNPIDARLLRIQARTEIEQWGGETPHVNSPSLYATLVAKAVAPILEARFLTAPERARLVCERLGSVRRLCTAAIASLQEGERNEVKQSLETLDQAATFYEEELPVIASGWKISPACADFAGQCQTTAAAIRSLIVHIATRLLPQAKEADPILGRERYARKLSLYVDNALTPEELAAMALREIEEVRGLMGEVSQAYLQKQYPGRPVPERYEALVSAALADMEKDAPKNGEEYLAFWQDLSAAAIEFIEEHQIATLPEFQTLRILPAPESAGPAARIGWVESAPPLAPNPLTTLYLPSIPDTLPEQERIDFWASFNKPFNRMIVIHELFPGHYMQIKISRETPHPVRLLFPYGPYFEGWATFCERVLLDAGWERNRPLTFLAHLRKRLENANRAYTSVQVHCNGWDQEQVRQFSTETALLAPQFAKSLWGRLMHSPLQMTSYFLGGAQFTELFEAEKRRLGAKFVLQDFMDTVMQTGPIPVDDFYRVFRP